MIDSKGGAFGFDCCLASPKFRVFQQPARTFRKPPALLYTIGPCALALFKLGRPPSEEHAHKSDRPGACRKYYLLGAQRDDATDGDPPVGLGVYVCPRCDRSKDLLPSSRSCVGLTTKPRRAEDDHAGFFLTSEQSTNFHR